MADFGVYLNGFGGNYNESKELWLARVVKAYIDSVDRLAESNGSRSGISISMLSAELRIGQGDVVIDRH